MSAEATGWVFRHSPATGSTFVVHLAIADVVNDAHDDEFYMRLAVLAAKARVSRATAQRAITWLLEHDLLDLLDESRQTTGRSVRYRFVMPDLAHDARGPSRTTREQVAHDARGGRAPRARRSRTTRDLDLTQEVTQEEPNRELSALALLAEDETPAVPDPFDAFWTAYPRKVDKGQARRAWKAAIKKADPAVIIQGALRYREQRQDADPHYTKHPSTWLNAEAWLNAPERGRPLSTVERSHAAIDQVFAEMEAGLRPNPFDPVRDVASRERTPE